VFRINESNHDVQLGATKHPLAEFLPPLRLIIRHKCSLGGSG
jgi:hypothetical protein